MAKKKATQRRPAVSDRVAFQVRLKNDVHAKIAEQAKASGVSLNQLIDGLLEGCAATIVRGRPVMRDGVVAIDEVPGCLFVGRRGFRYVRTNATEEEADDRLYRSPSDLQPHQVGTGNDAKAGRIQSRGCVAFELDFSASPVRVHEK